jgi:hypothetical protein
LRTGKRTRRGGGENENENENENEEGRIPLAAGLRVAQGRIPGLGSSFAALGWALGGFALKRIGWFRAGSEGSSEENENENENENEDEND